MRMLSGNKSAKMNTGVRRHVQAEVARDRQDSEAYCHVSALAVRSILKQLTRTISASKVLL